MLPSVTRPFDLSGFSLAVPNLC